jgi:hypothetical protein
VLGNRVVRKRFRPKKEEVVGSWRRLHNEELHNLNASPNIIRVIKSGRMGWAGHVARMREMRNAYNIFIRISEGKKSRERPTCRWEDNIRMDLGEIEWEVVDWIHLATDTDQCRVLENKVMNVPVP